MSKEDKETKTKDSKDITIIYTNVHGTEVIPRCQHNLDTLGKTSDRTQ